MTPDFAVQIFRETLAVVGQSAGPILLAALITGTLIAVLQSATQVNEMTLTFVPKLFAVGALLWVLASQFLQTLMQFGQRVFELVATLGGAA